MPLIATAAIRRHFSAAERRDHRNRLRTTA
jgi:hypothetical protein